MLLEEQREQVDPALLLFPQADDDGVDTCDVNEEYDVVGREELQDVVGVLAVQLEDPQS